MTTFRIIDLRIMKCSTVTLSQAAEIAELSEDEILWAIEEDGICETDLHVIADAADDAVAPAHRAAQPAC